MPMNNIFHTTSKIAENLNTSTLKKVQQSIDNKFTELDLNANIGLVLPSNTLMAHTNIERYSNGFIKNNGITAQEIDLSQEVIQELEEICKLQNEYKYESAKIVNHFKEICTHIILNTKLSQPQALQLVWDNLPDFIKQDKTLLDKADLFENEIDELNNNTYPYAEYFETKAEYEETLAKVVNPEVNDLMQKYYALDLLTNF